MTPKKLFCYGISIPLCFKCIKFWYIPISNFDNVHWTFCFLYAAKTSATQKPLLQVNMFCFALINAPDQKKVQLTTSEIENNMLIELFLWRNNRLFGKYVLLSWKKHLSRIFWSFHCHTFFACRTIAFRFQVNDIVKKVRTQL